MFKSRDAFVRTIGEYREFFDQHPRYVESLRRMRDTLLYEDEFGDECDDRWKSVFLRFVRGKMRGIGEVEEAIDDGSLDALADTVLQVLEESFAAMKVTEP